MPKSRELTAESRIMIFNRRQAGETLISIAKDYGMSPEGVRNICNRLKKRGDAENLPRTGRPRKTTIREDRPILKEVKKNPKITAKELKENLQLGLSLTRIRSRIHENGLTGRVCRAKPLLSAKHIKARKEFARQYKDQPMEFWYSVIFSDESKFEMFNTSRREYCRRKINQEFNLVNLKPTVKHGGGSVFVWGCFSYHGIGNLVFIDSHLTGEKYVDILDNNLSPSARKL